MYEFEITTGLSVSFQRFPYPESGSLSALPSSRGALPLYISGPAQLTVPSPSGEAFWIALLTNSSSAASNVAVLAYGRKGTKVDALTGLPVAQPPTTPTASVALPPHQFIPGIHRSAGMWWAFARDSAAPAPPSLAIGLVVRSWPIPDAAVPRLAGATRHYLPGGEPRKDRPSRRRDPGAVEDATLHIILTDESRFRRVSGQQIAPLDQNPGLGARRLP